jgi:hypothetical protein
MREVLISTLALTVPTIKGDDKMYLKIDNSSLKRNESYCLTCLIYIHGHLILQLRYMHVVQILQLDNDEKLTLSLLNVTVQVQILQSSADCREWCVDKRVEGGCTVVKTMRQIAEYLI